LHLILVFSRGLGPFFVSSGRSSACEPSEPLEVIGEVGHADLDPCTGDTDGTDEQPHAVFLTGKDMLDA
jgi:hypothetical protein